MSRTKRRDLRSRCIMSRNVLWLCEFTEKPGLEEIAQMFNQRINPTWDSIPWFSVKLKGNIILFRNWLSPSDLTNYFQLEYFTKWFHESFSYHEIERKKNSEVKFRLGSDFEHGTKTLEFCCWKKFAKWKHTWNFNFTRFFALNNSSDLLTRVFFENIYLFKEQASMTWYNFDLRLWFLCDQ